MFEDRRVPVPDKKNVSIAVKGGGTGMIAEEAEAEASSVLAWTGREDFQIE